MGFSMRPLGSSKAEPKPLTKKASSATLNAQSTATEVGRDPDMRRDEPRAPLLAAQPKTYVKHALYFPFGALILGGQGFFLALSAAGHVRGPSVHLDACLDPSRAP